MQKRCSKDREKQAINRCQRLPDAAFSESAAFDEMGRYPLSKKVRCSRHLESLGWGVGPQRSDRRISDPIKSGCRMLPPPMNRFSTREYCKIKRAAVVRRGKGGKGMSSSTIF